MRYRETLPSLLLAPYVRCFWTLESHTTLDPQLIIPDGCTELVFHFGDRFVRRLEDGTSVMQPLAFAVGQMERAVVIQPLGRADVLGVRFHPAGLSAFTAIPQHQLRGQMIAFDDIWGTGAISFDEPSSRLSIVERFLVGRLRPQNFSLASGDRQQRRRFQDLVGLSQKRLQRVERLQRAMSRLGRCDLTQVALDAGYFDQPHFTREFREFTGQTPSQFLRAPHAFSDFFTHTVRNVKDSGLPNRSH